MPGRFVVAVAFVVVRMISQCRCGPETPSPSDVEFKSCFWGANDPDVLREELLEKRSCVDLWDQGVSWCWLRYYTDPPRINKINRFCGSIPPELGGRETWKEDMYQLFNKLNAMNQKFLCVVNSTEVTCYCRTRYCNGVINKDMILSSPTLNPGWEKDVSKATTFIPKDDMTKLSDASKTTKDASGGGAGTGGGGGSGSGGGGSISGSATGGSGGASGTGGGSGGDAGTKSGSAGASGSDSGNSTTTAKPGGAGSSSVGIIAGAVVGLLVIGAVVGYLVYKRHSAGADEGGSEGGGGGGAGSGATAESEEAESE